MPIDGGNLIVEQPEIEVFRDDPVASKYLRRFVGSRELIQGIDRWCLWLEDLEPADLGQSKLLRDRVNSCRVFREAQPKGGDAYKYRSTPHLFRPNASRPKVSYLCLPGVVSENRAFYTVERLNADVIASNAVFTAEDPDGFAFAVASSSMFMVWQRSIGGRLKSDLRFSSTVVWNNLPLPPVQKDLRREMIRQSQEVLEVRARFPERSMADLYNPLAMDRSLLKAHAELDVVVDKAFGAKKRLSGNEERQTILFESFTRLSSIED
jgi:hypothetical protein